MKTARKPNNRNRLINGARNYALADRSDPFAFARCMTHVNNGIASIGSGRDGEDHCYSAEAYQEKRSLPRKPDGTPGDIYEVTAYKTMRRP